MVGFYEIGFGRAATFNRVGIDGTLPEDPMSVKIWTGFENVLLDMDEFLADDGAFPLGFGDSFERGEEVQLRVDNAEMLGAEGGKISRTNVVSSCRISPVST